MVQYKWNLVEKKTMGDLAIGIINTLVLIIGVILGVSCNLWIVYINLEDWRRGFHRSPADQILSFMALINASIQVMICFDMSSTTTRFYDIFDSIHLRIIDVEIFLISCNMWFTAWLSVYYYMKIVSFTGGLLLVLKMRISKLLPKLMVMSTVGSFVIALPSCWSIYTDEETIGNATYNSIESLIISSPYLITAFVGCIILLILTLLPIGLTLRSLWRHMKRMKVSSVVSSRPQTQAHVTAARTMVLLVTLHTIFNAVSIYVLFRSFNFVDISIVFCGYFIVLYPTFQALVMITGNSKLKKAGRDILRCGGTWCGARVIDHE
ncbi:taste receptor type 2 member 39-like [Dendropsophus ebraccatus]|uniref:taste receptor type 2 member 39-like n=1 Tax=Dendropsophus ebraccatus TaxID=150705 RepID=UPI003831607B